MSDGVPAQRIVAIDVLRGLTLALMIVVNMSVSDSVVYGQLAHAPWFGLTLTDLVFPSFLFVVGASLSRQFRQVPAARRCGRAAQDPDAHGADLPVRLPAVLVSVLPASTPTGTCRCGRWRRRASPGVLQRIALTLRRGGAAPALRYGGRAAAMFTASPRCSATGQLLYAFGDYTLSRQCRAQARSRCCWARRTCINGEGIAFDPEGILSTLPAIVNVLAGLPRRTGLRERGRNYETLTRLLLAGGLCIAVALFWNGVLPISKKLWTSSYALCTIGIDLYVLALLVYVIDLRGSRGWTLFLRGAGPQHAVHLPAERSRQRNHGPGVASATARLFEWLYEACVPALGRSQEWRAAVRAGLHAVLLVRGLRHGPPAHLHQALIAP